MQINQISSQELFTLYEGIGTTNSLDQQNESFTITKEALENNWSDLKASGQKIPVMFHHGFTGNKDILGEVISYSYINEGDSLHDLIKNTTLIKFLFLVPRENIKIFNDLIQNQTNGLSLSFYYDDKNTFVNSDNEKILTKINIVELSITHNPVNKDCKFNIVEDPAVLEQYLHKEVSFNNLRATIERVFQKGVQNFFSLRFLDNMVFKSEHIVGEDDIVFDIPKKEIQYKNMKHIKDKMLSLIAQKLNVKMEDIKNLKINLDNGSVVFSTNGQKQKTKIQDINIENDDYVLSDVEIISKPVVETSKVETSDQENSKQKEDNNLQKQIEELKSFITSTHGDFQKALQDLQSIKNTPTVETQPLVSKDLKTDDTVTFEENKETPPSVPPVEEVDTRSLSEIFNGIKK